MNERHFYFILLVFVAFGVVVLMRGASKSVPFRAGILFFLVVITSITMGWFLALKVARLVFGIYVIGWSSYVTHSVYITETQRHAVYLSDGRIILGGRADIYEDTHLISFFIIGSIIASLLVKIISWVSPSTRAAMSSLLDQKQPK